MILVGTNESLAFSWVIPKPYDQDYMSVEWYFNGEVYTYGSLQHKTFGSTQTVTVIQPGVMDEGIYEAAITLDATEYFKSQGCTMDLELPQFSLDSITLEVKVYGKTMICNRSMQIVH